MRQRVYIDTSVVGGCFDDRFAGESTALFDRFKKGELVAVVSETTLRELADAPPGVQEVVRSIPDGAIELVRETPEIVNLTRIRAYNSVNVRQGYPPIEIRSPGEVLDVQD